MNSKIRHASMNDLQRLNEIEALCFPVSQACSKEQMRKRLLAYPDYFQILEIDGTIVSFVNGPVVKESDLSDEMYENVHLHDPNGNWMMILGVDTDPRYRHHGYASQCLLAAVHQAEEEHLEGVVLTCLKPLISFYEQFHFVDEGISKSVHGSVTWHQMRLVL